MNNFTAAGTCAEKAPDYSKAEYWHQIPRITWDVDTFTSMQRNIISSFEEDAFDYAQIGNTDVMTGVADEYEAHASAFQDSTHAFLTY